MGRGYIKASDLPQVIPVFPLSGAIVLPRGQLPLHIFEPRYLNMVDDAMAGDRIIGMIQPAGGPESLPGLSTTGCAGRITSYAETADGRYLITLTGICRFRMAGELPVPTPYRQARADFAPFALDLDPPGETDDFERGELLAALRDYLNRRGLDIDWDAARDAPPEALINSLAMALPFEPPEKQALVEALTLAERLDSLTALLRIDAAEPGDDDPATMQ